MGPQNIKKIFRSRRLFSFGSLIYLFIILAIWLVLNRNNVRELFIAYQMCNRQLAEVRVLEKAIQKMEEERQFLIKGEFENEKVIRERYRMAKPGERLIILKEEQEKPK
jgi:cell division protein FtsB